MGAMPPSCALVGTVPPRVSRRRYCGRASASQFSNHWNSGSDTTASHLRRLLVPAASQLWPRLQLPYGKPRRGTKRGSSQCIEPGRQRSDSVWERTGGRTGRPMEIFRLFLHWQVTRQLMDAPGRRRPLRRLGRVEPVCRRLLSWRSSFPWWRLFTRWRGFLTRWWRLFARRRWGRRWRRARRRRKWKWSLNQLLTVGGPIYITHRGTLPPMPKSSALSAPIAGRK